MGTDTDAERVATRAARIARQDAAGEVDGRTARRRRNVDAVLTGYITLLAEGRFDPTAEEIAARAGVSHRSIYRYFPSRDELLAAVLRRIMDEIVSDDDPTPLDAPFAERCEWFARRRVEGYWRHRIVARSAFGHRNVTTGEVIAAARGALRRQTAKYFAAELAAVVAPDGDALLGILDAPFQFESLDYLANDVGLDADRMTEGLVLHLRAILTAR